jgi:hypothetical protein
MDPRRRLWQRLSVPRSPLLAVPAQAALAAAALLLLCFLAVPVAAAGDAATAGAVAVAAAGAAALAALTVTARDRIRPEALVLAWALILLWPLAGRPLPAAGIAVVAVALALWLGGARATAPVAAALAAGGLGVLGIAWLQQPNAAPVAPPRVVAEPPQRPAVLERTQTPRPAPVLAVRAYYRALDRRDFDAAWRLLGPSVRTGFGGRAAWERGFADTLSSRPSALRISTHGGVATVRHALVAADSAPCGRVLRRYALTWTLRRTGTGWRAAAVRGVLRTTAAVCDEPA